jgi:hypothetical protein
MFFLIFYGGMNKMKKVSWCNLRFNASRIKTPSQGREVKIDKG